MKKVDYDYWTYWGFDIYTADHPKLQGKYEIYQDDHFISRAYTLNEAKQKITNYIKTGDR